MTLLELAAKWDDEADKVYNIGRRDALRECATELRKLAGVQFTVQSPAPDEPETSTGSV